MTQRLTSRRGGHEFNHIIAHEPNTPFNFSPKAAPGYAQMMKRCAPPNALFRMKPSNANLTASDRPSRSSSALARSQVELELRNLQRNRKA